MVIHPIVASTMGFSLRAPPLICAPFFVGLIFTSHSSLFLHPGVVAFFVGVPKRFFLKMSLTLPPPLGVPFTSLLNSFFGLGDSLPGVNVPFLFSGLGVSLSDGFALGVAALLAGLLDTIFFSGISIEK